MKNSLLSIVVLSLALVVASPSAWADALQNSSPGAQGTEGTNPTHQDQNVTGPNGEHTTNTNPADDPAPAHKKHHKKCSSTACTTHSAST